MQEKFKMKFAAPCYKDDGVTQWLDCKPQPLDEIDVSTLENGERIVKHCEKHDQRKIIENHMGHPRRVF